MCFDFHSLKSCCSINFYSAKLIFILIHRSNSNSFFKYFEQLNQLQLSHMTNYSHMTHYSWDFSQFEICGSHVERCVPLQSTCTNPKLCTCGSHAEHCVPLPFLPVSVHSRSSFISVWGNRLSGALPSTLWTITSLTSLDLSTNYFRAPFLH